MELKVDLAAERKENKKQVQELKVALDKERMRKEAEQERWTMKGRAHKRVRAGPPDWKKNW